MIEFSNTVQSVLQGISIEAFYLVKIGSQNKTTYFRDLIVNGDLYVADGTIVQIEPPQLSSTVDRQPFKITLADAMFQYGPLAEKGLLGTMVEVRIAFANDITGDPYTNIDDTLLVYKGKIDGTAYVTTTERVGESFFVVTCTTPMSDLDLTKQFFTSQDFLDKNYPGDTSYEQIFEGSAQINLKWGRK